MIGKRVLKLQLLDPEFGILELDTNENIPDWVLCQDMYALTRTDTEITIVCPFSEIPGHVHCDSGWKCLKIEGVFDFNEIGIIANISTILAQNDISVYVISTYKTDYILIKEKHVNRAIGALQEKGHRVFD